MQIPASPEYSEYNLIPYSPDIVAESPYPEETQDDPKEPRGLMAWTLLPLAIATGIFEQKFGMSWIPQVVAVCVISLWVVVDLVVRRQGLRLYPPFILLGSWVLWELIPTIAENVPTEVIVVGALGIVKVWALSCVVSNIVRRPQQLIPLFIGASLVPVILVYTYRDDIAHMQAEAARGIQSDEYRLGEVRTGESLGNANRLAEFACYDLVAAVSLLLLFRSKILKGAALAVLPPILLYITLTGSRTGMMAIPMLAVAFWFFYLRDISRRRPVLRVLGIVFMAVMLVGAFVFILTSPFAYRFTDRTSSYSEGRGALALVGLRMTLDSPLFGFGLFGFGEHGAEYGAPSGLAVTHNMYVEALVEGGLPGFLLYFGAWFAMMHQMWRLRKFPVTKQERIALNMSLLCCMVFLWCSIAGSSINCRMTWIVIGACIGVTYAIRDKYAALQQQETFQATVVPYSQQQYLTQAGY